MRNKKAIDIFKEIISEELEKTGYKEISVNKTIEKLGLLRIIIRKVFPPIIKKAIHHFLEYRQENSQYFFSLGEKRWSLDFLNYVLKNNPEIPYMYFPESDWQEIDKFVKNKFLASLFNKLNKNQLFDEQDLEKQTGARISIEEYDLNYIKNKEKLIGSTIIDCGAFIGDTAYLFNQKLNPKKIIAIEPNLANYNQLLKTIALKKMGNVIPVQKGVGEKQGNFYMEFSGASAYLSYRETEQKIEVDSIDNLIKELRIKDIGLIKMDIEGSELPAIRGAQETIRKFKPALIICLYHRGQDFFEIPRLIKELVPQYKFRFVNFSKESPIHDRILIAEYEN